MRGKTQFIFRLFFGALLALGLMTGCSVGPDYHPPDVTGLTPSDWRWKTAHPQDAVPKGEWWKEFHDTTLDQLEAQAIQNNQDLRAALARIGQARAQARVSGSNFFPGIGFTPSASRMQASGTTQFDSNGNPGGSSGSSSSSFLPNGHSVVTLDSYTTPFDLSYEIDLWGRVRRSFEAAHDLAQASMADYGNVLLTLNADVAVNYFQLRAHDAEIATLREAAHVRKEAVDFLTKRRDAGKIGDIDLDRARAEYSKAAADLADTVRLRDETQNMLALLCGASASAFSIPEASANLQPPEIPAGLPSTLLERRPDVAKAERELAAKNAQIGVAIAGYFPTVCLTGKGGYSNYDASGVFSWEGTIWSLGPNVSLPIFNGGRTTAQVNAARSTYDEAIARYRQQVLVAFKDVEDSLAQIRFRREQRDAMTQATVDARKATTIARARYDAGAVTYLEVVDAERTQLQYEREDVQVGGEQMMAAVRLIKALGGGWAMPTQ